MYRFNPLHEWIESRFEEREKFRDFNAGLWFPVIKHGIQALMLRSCHYFNRNFWKSFLKCIYEFPINFGFAEKNLQVTRIVYNVYVYRGLSVAFFFFEFRYVNLIVKKRKNHAIHIYMYIYSSISEIVSLPTLIHFLADEIN